MPPIRSLPLLLLAVACGSGASGGVGKSADGGDGSAHADAGGGVSVTVANGYGGGRFASGTSIHVWSDVNPQTSLVTAWTGASGAPTEWNGDFTVPARDVTLTPTVVTAAPAFAQRTYALAEGSRGVLGVFPSAPVGLVLFFHGAEFDVQQLRSNAATTIVVALVRAGYAVVAPPSEAETAMGVGPWNTALTGNADLDNVTSLVAALRADGTVSASAPVVAWGMSSGGFFAHTVGAELPAAAVVAYCAPGNADALAATHAKTAWYLAAEDQTFPMGASQSQAFLAQLAARGITTDLYVHPTTPLYPQRFERVGGVGASASAAIAASLLAKGDVDASGAWLVTGSSITADLDLAGLSGLSADQVTAVGEEIEIMAADHELYDDVADRMVAFLGGG